MKKILLFLIIGLTASFINGATEQTKPLENYHFNLAKKRDAIAQKIAHLTPEQKEIAEIIIDLISLIQKNVLQQVKKSTEEIQNMFYKNDLDTMEIESFDR